MPLKYSPIGHALVCYWTIVNSPSFLLSMSFISYHNINLFLFCSNPGTSFSWPLALGPPPLTPRPDWGWMTPCSQMIPWRTLTGSVRKERDGPPSALSHPHHQPSWENKGNFFFVRKISFSLWLWFKIMFCHLRFLYKREASSSAAWTCLPLILLVYVCLHFCHYFGNVKVNMIFFGENKVNL